MAATLTSSGIQFSDSTVQTTAGLPLTGGTMSGQLNLPTIKVSSGFGLNNYRQYKHTFTGSTSGGAVNLLYNTGSYDDIFFLMTVFAYHSGRSYQMFQGVWGGYGNNFSQTNGGGIFTLTTTSSNSAGGPSNLSAGYNYLQINWGSLAYPPGTTIYAQFYGYGGLSAVNGTLY
jgi:hypothetical protein